MSDSLLNSVARCLRGSLFILSQEDGGDDREAVRRVRGFRVCG